MVRIIVLGPNRSGTKYLTNLIAANFNLACIQSSEHDGVVESNVIGNYIKIFGLYPNLESRLASLHLFTKEAAFVASGLSMEELYSLEWNTYVEFWRFFLDASAKKKGRQGWVHKSNSLFYTHFKDPSILKVFVNRNISSIYKSTLKLKKKSRYQKFKLICMLAFRQRSDKRMAKKSKSLLIKYEDLLKRSWDVFEKLHDFIDIEMPEQIRDVKFSNSSFRKGESIKLNIVEKLCIRLATLLMKLMPGTIIGLVDKHFVNSRFKAFVSGSFSRAY